MGNDGNPFTLLIVNGVFNTGTIKALQWKLNAETGAGLVVDGAYGTHTCDALERHIGLPATNTLYPGNGSPNPQVLTLQAWITNVGGFPVSQDGYWGTHTDSGLQLSLNSTRF